MNVFVSFCPPPFLSFWLLTQLQTEPVWLYERHFLLLLFFFSSRLQPTSCFPLVLHTHSLGGQHIMLQALLNSRNPSETLSDRGFSKQIVGKKSSEHWDLSSGKPSRRSQGVGTEGGEGGVVWMRSVKAVNRSLYVNSCLLWISRQG